MSPKESATKSFKVKFFLNELPTMENMYKRDKKKYKSDICQRCLKYVENNDHWIECRDNEVSKYQLIYKTVTKLLTKSNSFSEQKTKDLTNILYKEKNKEGIEINPLARIITKEDEKRINAFAKDSKRKRNFSCYVLHKINTSLYKQIWKRR